MQSAICNLQSAICNLQSAIKAIVPNSHYVRCKSSLVMAFQQVKIGKMALRSNTHPVIRAYRTKSVSGTFIHSVAYGYLVA